MTRQRTIFLSLFVLVASICVGAAIPQQNAPNQAQQASSPLRFEFGGDVAEIPAQFVGNLVFLPVRINDGSPSLFLLDSSTAATSIAPSRAQSLGLGTQQTGATSGIAIPNCSLQLPGVLMAMNALPVVPRDDFAAQVGRAFEGALGEDFFQRAVVKVDYARKTVEVYDSSTFKYSASGRSFPLAFVNGMPVIRGKFELLKGGNHEGDFIINTSIEASAIVAEEFSEQHHIFYSHGKTIQAVLPQWDAGENVELARLKAFRIGPYAIENAVIAFSGREWPGAQGLKIAGEIGGGLLRHFAVIFDIPHKQLILEPNSNFQEEEQEDKSGLSVIAQGPGLKTFEVVRVQPGTPGAEAGIRKGDVIAGIDNDAAADLTLNDVRDLFRQVGHEYKLLIERNGQTLNISVQMRRLL